MSLALTTGVFVQHSVWGLGKVVKMDSPHVLIDFPALKGKSQGRRRKLSPTASQLHARPDQTAAAVEWKRANSSTEIGKAKDTPPIGSLDQAIASFQRQYPGRFRDPT